MADPPDPDPLAPDRRVARPEWVAHVHDGDRAVLLHLPSGRRVVLSPEATAIWTEVVAAGDDGVTGEQVAAALAPRYRVARQVLTDDVHALLVQLHEQGFVAQVVPPSGG